MSAQMPEGNGLELAADPLPDERWRDLLRVRATRPEAIAEAYARRRRPGRFVGPRGTLFLIVADHPARGALAVPGAPMAMADRRGLLRRLLVALAHPEVDGVVGTPDVVEELLLLGALEGKVVVGSMNRGGLYGAEWGMDDRFTGYEAAAIQRYGLEGGKMLLRIDDDDQATAPTIEACARAVSALAERGLVALVEPLPYARDYGGAPMLQRDGPSLSRAVTIASALGTTSAWTWLKLPAPEDPDVVFAATTLPCVVLGGVPGPDVTDDIAAWSRALRHPVVRGLVAGRAVLYPPRGDVSAAVDAAARALRAASDEPVAAG
jgi:uncharacterized protein